MSFAIIQNDLSPNLGVIVDISGLVEPLSIATSIQLHWVKPDGTASLVTLTAVNLATGSLKYVWQAGDTAQYGVHQGRVIVVTSTGKPQTFPSDGSWICWYVAPYVPTIPA